MHMATIKVCSWLETEFMVASTGHALLAQSLHYTGQEVRGLRDSRGVEEL